VAFSPDGRQLASAGGASQNLGEVKLWDAATGRELCPLRGHTDLVEGVAFSPDGRLATASLDRTIKLWDTATGHEVCTLRGHTSGVLCVAFSPDGRRIVSGSIDWTAKVWDLDPIRAETIYRREASERVAALYKQRRDEPAVIQKVESETLPAPVRQAAIEIAGRLGDHYARLNQVERAHEVTKKARELAQSRTAAPTETLEAFQRARGLWNDLIAADPDSAEYRKELALVLVDIGELQDRAGRGDEADPAFDEAFRLAEGLRRGGWLGGNVMWGHVAYEILGGVAIHEQSRHRPEKALRARQERLAIWDALAPVFAGDSSSLRGLKTNQLVDLSHISRIQRDTGHTPEALSSSRRAVAIAVELLQEKPDNTLRLYALGFALCSVAGLQREVGGAASPETRAALGDFSQRLERFPDPTGVKDLYSLACLYSVLSGVGPAEQALPADKVQRKQTAAANRAMAVLRRAVAAGWKDAAHMRRDSDLDPLRARMDFQVLLLDLEFPAEPFAR
jgi:tetratricopeptide (TPR) repeat protein